MFNPVDDIEMQPIYVRPVQPANNYIQYLPNGVLGLIRDRLNFLNDVIPLSLVCRSWHSVFSKDPRWEVLCRRYFGHVTSEFSIENGEWKKEFIEQRSAYSKLCTEEFRSIETSKDTTHCETWALMPMEMNVEQFPVVGGRGFLSDGYMYGISHLTESLTRWRVGEGVDAGEQLSSRLSSRCKMLAHYKNMALIFKSEGSDSSIHLLRTDTGKIHNVAFNYGGITDLRPTLKFSKFLMVLVSQKDLLILDEKGDFIFGKRIGAGSQAAVLNGLVLVSDESGINAVFPRRSGRVKVSQVAPIAENEVINYLGSDPFSFYAIISDRSEKNKSRAIQFDTRGNTLKSFTLDDPGQLESCRIVDGKLFAFSDRGLVRVDFRAGTMRITKNLDLLRNSLLSGDIPSLAIQDKKLFGRNGNYKVVTLEPAPKSESFFSKLFSIFY